MSDKKYEMSDSYESVGEAIIAHAGIITFILIMLLMKIGVLPKHILLIIICTLAGVWGIFELMGSKYTVLATIGWVIAALWLIFGNRGIFSGY